MGYHKQHWSVGNRENDGSGYSGAVVVSPTTKPKPPLRPIPRQEFYSLGETANLFSVATSTVAYWFDGGQVTGCQLLKGRRDRRISHESIEAFARSNGRYSFVLDRLGQEPARETTPAL